MKILTCIFAAGVFSVQAIFAQNAPVNSGKIILEGIDKYDKGNYEEALLLFRKVPEYDTNGTLALYEGAMALSALDRNDESYAVSKRLIEEFKYYQPATYNLWGSAADNSGKPDEALQIYKQGLKLYPMSNIIAFNAGITYLKQEKIDSSYHYSIRAANINPLHPGSYNVLALANIGKGRVVPAMLSFIHGLLLGLEDKSSVHNYNNLNTLSSGGFDADLKKASKSYEGFGADFKDADYLITSRSALSANYKKKFKLREASALQTLFLIDMLEEEHEKIPFYGPLNIRFLRQVKAAGLSEVLAYALYIPTNHATINSYFKKNASKLKQLMEIFYKNINEFRAKKSLEQYGMAPGEYDLTYYKNGYVETAIAVNETPNKGKASYIFLNDGSLTLEGFTKNDKFEGEAIYYSSEGKIEERRNYVNSEMVGKNTFYFSDGTVRADIIHPKNPETDTLFFTFYYRDGVTPDFSYKKVNGKFEGLNRQYFADGKLKLAINNKNDMPHGTRTEYYENGDIKSVENYVDGEKDGSALYYYVGGKKSSEGSYKENHFVGEWKSYFEDGKLSSVNQYNDKGIDIGQSFDYYEDGSIAQEQNFDLNGNQNGTIKLYSRDKKIHTEFTFANKKVKGAKTYDANGKEVYNASTTNKKLSFYKNDSYHKLFEKGIIDNDERVGDFIEFRNGKDTASITPYKKGLVNGEVKKFFSNKMISEISTYADNEMDGKYVDYHLNGKESIVGYYVKGNAEGYWKYYYDNGNVSEIRFYLGDEKHGKFESFDIKGNLIEAEFYENGKKTKEIKYLNGQPVDTIDLNAGKTDVETRFENGNLKDKYTILNGFIHGKYIHYYPNGKEANVSNYVNGAVHGDYKRYYPNGKQLAVIPYVMDRIHGKAIYYGENGKVEKEMDYKFGKYDGKQILYYHNGKKYKETEFKGGEINGTRTYYEPDGKVIVQLFYERDYLVGYTYTDKTGKLLPMIPIENGSGRITAYYASGAKSCEMGFKHSYLDGKQTMYYPNSESPLMTENWENSQQNGDQTYYDYGPGKKSSQFSMKFGNNDGFFREYHPNGKVQFEAEFENDKVKDSEKRYTESGALESHFTYTNGILTGFVK